MKIEIDKKQAEALQEALSKLLQEEEEKRKASILKIEAIFQLQNQLAKESGSNQAG